MTDSDRIVALEARLAAAEGRIAVLEGQMRATVNQLAPSVRVAPQVPGWPWTQCTGIDNGNGVPR